MRRMWKNLTENDDGTPLMDVPYLAPLALAAAVGSVIWSAFF